MRKTYKNYEKQIVKKKIALRLIKAKKKEIQYDEKHNKVDEND